MLFHLRIWGAYVAQYLKKRMIYTADFWTNLVADLSLQGVNLLFITVVFQKTPELHGWTRNEVYFIYGLAIMSYGLFHAFFSGIYYLGDTYIVQGNLDRVLLRPVNPLLQILSEKVYFEDACEALTGFAVLIYASWHLHLAWTLARVIALPLCVACGVAIFLGVFTTLASMSFWFVDRAGMLPPIYNMMQFGRFPVTIYNRQLRFLLCWVIPFAFISFFPSTWFLGRSEFFTYFLITPVVAVAFFGTGCLVFNLGLKRYESTGS